MREQFNAIRDAWNKTREGGRDENKARELSDGLVAANPEAFAAYDSMTQEQLVAAHDVFRAAGMVDDMDKIQAYLFHKYEPQSIGGAVKSIVRIPGQPPRTR